MNAATNSELNYLRDRFNGTQQPESLESDELPTLATADWSESAATWVGEHPRICVGAALVLGVTIGWLVKRR